MTKKQYNGIVKSLELYKEETNLLREEIKNLNKVNKELTEQLSLAAVSKSFKTELEMREIATEKYHEHNYGDAKYDGFMECYRMLVKEEGQKTRLSK